MVDFSQSQLSALILKKVIHEGIVEEFQGSVYHLWRLRPDFVILQADPFLIELYLIRKLFLQELLGRPD